MQIDTAAFQKLNYVIFSESDARSNFILRHRGSVNQLKGEVRWINISVFKKANRNQ